MWEESVWPRREVPTAINIPRPSLLGSYNNRTAVKFWRLRLFLFINILSKSASRTSKQASINLHFNTYIGCLITHPWPLYLLKSYTITTVHTNRKTCMTSPVTLSHLTLSDLDMSNSRSLGFRSLISCKGAELGHMLLLSINRKAYMGRPMTLSHLTLSDFEVSVLRSLRFRSHISCKGA